MKIIETPRLLLRRVNPEEYKELFEKYEQEDIMRFWGFTTEEQYKVEVERYKGGLTTFRTSFIYFLLIEKDSSRVLGDCCFHTWYFIHSRAELGYGLRNDADKRKGYMREALTAVLDYGFGTMNLNRVEAYISPSNLPSQKLVKSFGFQQEGIMKEHYLKDGVLDDSLVFALLKNEYNK